MTRQMLSRLTCAALAVLAVLAFAPAASATDSYTIIADCEDDGRLQGRYSASDLRKARKDVPADVAEYSNCLDVLRRAEVSLSDGKGGGGGAVSGGGGGGAVGGASSSGAPLTPATPQEAESLRKAADTSAAIEVDGRKVVPGASGLRPSGARSDLPTTLIVALVLIGVLAAAAAVPALRRRFGGPRPLGA